MPNWCHNTLIVTGDPLAVRAYVDHVKTEFQPLSFEIDAPDGGGWEGVNAWGTKWDANFAGPFAAIVTADSDVELSVSAQGLQVADGVAIYKFDTAWSPPDPWLVTTAAKHPDLEFTLTYGEPGGDFAGRFYAHDSEVREEELQVKDVLAPEEMWF